MQKQPRPLTRERITITLDREQVAAIRTLTATYPIKISAFVAFAVSEVLKSPVFAASAARTVSKQKRDTKKAGGAE